MKNAMAEMSHAGVIHKLTGYGVKHEGTVSSPKGPPNVGVKKTTSLGK